MLLPPAIVAISVGIYMFGYESKVEECSPDLYSALYMTWIVYMILACRQVLLIACSCCSSKPAETWSACNVCCILCVDAIGLLVMAILITVKISNSEETETCTVAELGNFKFVTWLCLVPLWISVGSLSCFCCLACTIGSIVACMFFCSAEHQR